MADQWMREGLQIEVEDVQRSIVADTGKFIDDQVSRLGKDLKLVQHITRNNFVQHTLYEVIRAQQKLQLEPEGTGRQRLEDLIQESETQISTLQDEIDETVPKMKLARDVAAASSPELKARLSYNFV